MPTQAGYTVAIDMLNNKIHAAILVLATMLSTSPAGASFLDGQHSAPAESEPRDHTTFRSGTLPNGFRYVIAVAGNGGGTALINFRVDVGVANTEGRLLQAPHVLEHLLLLRSPDVFDAARISRAEQVRRSLKATTIGASTGTEATSYRFEVPSAKLSGVLVFLRGIAYGRELKDADIRSETRIALSETLLRSDDRSVLQTAFRNFGSPSLSKDNLAGRVASLRNLRAEDVQAIYTKWYRANSQTIYIVGDVDSSAVEREIIRLFSDIPAGAPKATKLLPIRDASTGLIAYLQGLSASTSTLLLDYKSNEGGDSAKPKAVRAILALLLGKELEKRRSALSYPILSSSVIGDNNQWRSLPSGIDIQYTASIGSFEAATAELYAVMNEIARGQFDKDAFASFQKRIGSSAAISTNHICKNASDIMSALNAAASDGNLGEIDCRPDFTKDDVGAVSETDIQKEMQRLLADSRMGFLSVTRSGDKSVSLAEVRKAKALSGQAIERDAQAGTELGRLKPLVPFGETSNKPALEVVGTDIYRAVGSGGPKVFIRHMDGENIVLQAFGPGLGSLPIHQRASAETAAQLVKRNGVRGLKADALNQYLAQSAMGYDIRLAPEQSLLEVTGPAKELPALLNILYELLGARKIDPEVRRDVAMRLGAAAQTDAEIFEALADRAIQLNQAPPETWPGPGALSVIPDDAAVARIWTNLFGDSAQLVLVGSASSYDRLADGMQALASKLPARTEGVPRPAETRLWDGGRRKFSVHRGFGLASNVAIFVALHVGDRKGNDVAAGLSAALGGRTRFYHRLREIEGGAYSPRVGIRVDPIDRSRVLLDIRFTCDPAETTRLVEAVWKEIEDIQQNGFAGDEADRLRKFQPATEAVTAASIARVARAARDPIDIAARTGQPVSVEAAFGIIRSIRKDSIFLFEARP